MESTRYSCQIFMNFELSRKIIKNILISNFMKILPVTAELFYTDGRTDMTEHIVVFRNFVKGLKLFLRSQHILHWKTAFYKMYPIRGIRNVTHSLTQTRVLRRPNGRYPHYDC